MVDPQLMVLDGWVGEGEASRQAPLQLTPYEAFRTVLGKHQVMSENLTLGWTHELFVHVIGVSALEPLS